MVYTSFRAAAKVNRAAGRPYREAGEAEKKCCPSQTEEVGSVPS